MFTSYKFVSYSIFKIIISFYNDAFSRFEDFTTVTMKMPSSRMLHLVALVGTDVSEQPNTSMI
jgi:hypothetical protein